MWRGVRPTTRHYGAESWKAREPFVYRIPKPAILTYICFLLFVVSKSADVPNYGAGQACDIITSTRVWHFVLVWESTTKHSKHGDVLWDSESSEVLLWEGWRNHCESGVTPLYRRVFYSVRDIHSTLILLLFERKTFGNEPQSENGKLKERRSRAMLG